MSKELSKTEQLREELKVLVEKEKFAYQRKIECLSALQREHQHEHLLAMRDDHGDYHTVCLFCGAEMNLSFTDNKEKQEWKKGKKIHWTTKWEFERRKERLSLELGIELTV